MVDEKTVKKHLSRTIERTNFGEFGTRWEGKVRDCYVKGENIVLVATDRVSVSDVNVSTFPFKGQVLNRMAAFGFEATKHLAPNHVICVPDANVTIAQKCTPLAVEMVVRDFLTGSTATSIWTAYKSGERVFCGHQLPNGMRKHQKLERPLLTPATKAQKGAHDRSLSREGILDLGEITAKDFDTMAQMAMQLFEFGQASALERGLILVDTKYEFGRSPQGDIILIDEIHTPDSSRFWYAESYADAFASNEDPPALDKEYVRTQLKAAGFMGQGPIPPIKNWLRVEAARRYMAVFEILTGTEFVPDMSEPMARIKRNVEAFFYPCPSCRNR